jgi:hypothetical protein
MKTLIALAVLVTSVASAHATFPVSLAACLGGVGNYPDASTAPVAVGSSQGATFELWRLECVEPAGVFLALLRVPDLQGCVQATYIRAFTICSAQPLALTTNVGPVFSSIPDRDAVVVSFQGVPIVSLPALPPAEPPLTVSVFGRGCSPCGTGEVVSLWAQFTNPNPAPVTVKVFGALLGPEGFELHLSPADDQVIPPGTSELLLLETIVGAEAPTGSYFLEGAILTPSTGVTLSRSRARGEKLR